MPCDNTWSTAINGVASIMSCSVGAAASTRGPNSSSSVGAASATARAVTGNSSTDNTATMATMVRLS